jgi:biotin carboxylase
MSTVLLVQSEPGFWVRMVADRITAAGHRSVLVSAPMTELQREQIHGLVDEVVELETVFDPELLAETARGYGDDAFLFTCTDITMVATARAAEIMGTARVPSKVLAAIRNKHEARCTLRAAGLANPGFALMSGVEEAEDIADEIGLPVVVKPVNGSGSSMVKVARTAEELADAYRLLAERLPGAMGGLYDRLLDGGPDLIDPTRVFLVEGMLQGPEYCMDAVIRDGEVETLKLMGKPLTDEAFFENIFVVPPFGMTPEREARLRQTVVDAVLAVGLDDTLAHVELIDDVELGPTIVEVNPGRPGGGMVSVVNELTNGMDMFGETLAAALNGPRPPRTPPKITIPLAYCIVFATGSGRLVRIHGLEEVAGIPEVLQVVATVEPGQILSADHEILAVNMLIAGYLDADDLASIYGEAVKLIRLETEPIPETGAGS